LLKKETFANGAVTPTPRPYMEGKVVEVGQPFYQQSKNKRKVTVFNKFECLSLVCKKKNDYAYSKAARV
jgi:hypothetical protein